MKILFGRIASFFAALLFLAGAYGSVTTVKTAVPVKALELSDISITYGRKIHVPYIQGHVRFNRISFSYKATTAVRVLFNYQQDGNTMEEELLISSKETKASMLLNNYLSGKSATRLNFVDFEPVNIREKCRLTVTDFTCDMQTVLKDKVVYIENEFYKAGITLKWGGGLCFFEDKHDGKYGNLLNCHDNGRLVQQSYYGPMDIPGYENGFYGDSYWCYNPVQGGDVYANTSKLVALEKTDNQIRVVCRPLDWAQDNKPTQCYYTNIYTLTEYGLCVENTAVDFLDVEWDYRAQEVPAFYSISALDTLVFYDGDKPWTGDTLRVEKNLPFWAGTDAHPLAQGNDENWCAWVDGNEYGIGLYSPIATHFLYGRASYDGSPDPNSNSTNYVAPLAFFVLDFDEPFTYFYYLTAGSVSQIRETFQSLS